MYVACKICVDNNRKWRVMTKPQLKQHIISFANKKSRKNKSTNAKLLHDNVTNIKSLQLVLGRHFIYPLLSTYSPPLYPTPPFIKSETLQFRSTSIQTLCDFCPKCNRKITKKSFVWTNCGHYYCVKCAADIFNYSLSKLNTIPNCRFPNCNKLLNNKNGYHLLSLIESKYKTKPIIEYDKAHKTFYGYLRQHGAVNIPNGVALLMFDFYTLFFITKIDCVKCCADGFVSINCRLCNGKGMVTIKCVYGCANGSVKCIAGKCKICNGSEKTCIKCNGLGKIIKIRPCSNCNGSGTQEKVCNVCDENNKIQQRCRECRGNKYLYTLDFNKLCHNQLQCQACKCYYPTKQIRYWSICCHTFCVQCFVVFVYQQIKSFKIPICTVPNCKFKAELLYKEMKTIRWSKIKKARNIKNEFKALKRDTKRMISMGFEQEKVRKALELGKGRIEMAISFIKKT
eukprot:216392_1